MNTQVVLCFLIIVLGSQAINAQTQNYNVSDLATHLEVRLF